MSQKSPKLSFLTTKIYKMTETQGNLKFYKLHTFTRLFRGLLLFQNKIVKSIYSFQQLSNACLKVLIEAVNERIDFQQKFQFVIIFVFGLLHFCDTQDLICGISQKQQQSSSIKNNRLQLLASTKNCSQPGLPVEDSAEKAAAHTSAGTPGCSVIQNAAKTSISRT
eukprot:TRINITY_DN14916_c0_g1_i1.p3 TRINITY_DN14916_c0_g1~~TRINITY_DN14916_c0_g1_i1.p3  ORF type:complete len:166 (-),score=5.56 TRINITY_DN14916_c0_g1_i1:26-523(-)